jgi:hypothetical protein
MGYERILLMFPPRAFTLSNNTESYPFACPLLMDQFSLILSARARMAKFDM